MMSNNQEPQIDSSMLEGLSPEEKEVALNILKQFVKEGQSDILREITYGDFEEIPVDIEEFLDSDYYLGKALWEVDPITGERKCTLWPYWREKLKDIFPDNLTTKYNTIILTGAIGLGKAQPLDALVLTEHGFKKMGELTLQDKIFGNDGKLHNIIGIFPQGKKKMCKVSFTDKTSTICCDEHLWTVYNTKNQVWTTVETKQLIDGPRNLKHSAGHRYKIPMTAPIEFEKKSLEIDPYILGVLIGDGCLSNNSTTFASADLEIIDKISSKLINNYEVRKLKSNYSYIIGRIKAERTPNGSLQPNYYTQAIKELDLDKTAEYKHIPKKYLMSSVEDRIQLLQGLMDTDGFISKDGANIEFSTINSRLKDDFVFLVQSLGGICHIRKKKTSYFNKKLNEKIEGKLCYNIGIKLPKDICPFALSRKVERLNPKALEPFRYITNIEYIGEDECQCIYIDSQEHLYLTNDFIVTHNTQIAVITMLYLLYRMLCLKDPYAYYGMTPIDKLTFSMLNCTIEAAKGVAWDKAQQMLQISPWFMGHGNLNMSRTNPQWQPPKGIEMIFGSNNNHVIGRALFCLEGNTEIVTTKGIYSLKNLVGKSINVISIDEKGKQIISDSCTVQETMKTNEEIQIELEDGTAISCTPNHRLMLKNGDYKEAQYLTENDELMESHQTYEEFMKIKSIKKVILDSPKQYYDVIEAAPFNNFLIKTNNSYIVSHNCNISDEVNFSAMGNNVEKHKQKLKRLIAQIDARMRSRFLRGTYLPTVNIIISSKDSEQAFLDGYIKRKRDNESKTSLIVEESQWTVDPRKGSPEDPGTFWVAVGNKFLTNELLPKDASEELVDSYRAKGYSMIKVPPGYRENFEDNLDQALMDIVGLSGASATKFISGAKLNAIKVDDYLNLFTKDIIEVGNGPDDFLQYANFFDLSRVKPSDMSKPLFIHLDMSFSRDKTGIVGTWIEGKRPSIEGDDNSRTLFYKVAFATSVKAPNGHQISFEKTRIFINWLREQGFSIKSISMDTFQSAQMYQELLSDGFNVTKLSVDVITPTHAQDEKGRAIKQCIPYEYLKTAINERHIKLFKKCDLLTEELVNLEKASNGKVDHPQNGCFTGDTKVSLVDGRELTFLELVEEYKNNKVNYIYSFNEKTKKIEPKPIKKAWRTRKDAELVEVTLDSGEVIRCTPNHLFMLRDSSYCQASDLTSGVSLMPLYRRFPNHKVVSIKILDIKEDVYDIEVVDNHNFALTCGIFVHNSKDAADGLAGSVYSASLFADQYALDYGETLDAIINVNVELNDEERKRNMIADFERELTAIYTEIDANDQKIRQDQRDEYNFYKDLMDGIIVI